MFKGQPYATQQFFDSNGNPLVGGKIYTYAAGTTTPQATYTDSTGNTPNTNPVILNSRGEAKMYMDSSLEYFVEVKNSSDELQYTEDYIGNSKADEIYANDGASGSLWTTVQGFIDDVISSTGAAFVGFIQSGVGAVARTLQSKARESISVMDFGVIGDGSDETTKIQAAINAAAGKRLDLGSGLTIGISSTITPKSNSQYFGSSTIKALPSSIAGPMLDLSGCSFVGISGIEVDANAANSGAYHGIQLSGGNGNSISNCHIHDTMQAGIRAEKETSLKITGNRIIDCGRNGYTDNHGIMVYATDGTTYDIHILGNTVKSAYRKGITTYSAGLATLSGVVIAGNTVSDCALGGIYTGNAPGAIAQQDVVIIGNRCNNNYVNIEISNLDAGVVDGNVCNGTSGGQGIYVNDCLYTGITNNTVYKSQADGIKVIGTLITPVGINVSDNIVAMSSQDAVGTYDGIDLNSVQYSKISGNIILGETASPKQGYGIQESGTCDYNQYSDNKIANTHTGQQAVYVGSNNCIHSTSGKNTAINSAIPNNTLDINGGLSVRDSAIVLANGANNNVALPINAGTLYVSGPTGVYNISGIAGGASGRKVTLFNYTSYVMTINHNSGSSSAGNRILIGGSADITISSFGSVGLTYFAGSASWAVTEIKS